MKQFISAVLFYFVFAFGIFAGPVTEITVDPSAPTVPAEILAQGRQAVTTHLLSTVDSVSVVYHGHSLLEQGRAAQHFLTMEDLRERGYVTQGSFSQLSAAVAGLGSTVQLVELHGDFDLKADVTCYDKWGKVVLTGSAHFQFAKTGDGLEGSATVYMTLPSNVLIRTSGYLREARWIGSEGVTSLTTAYDEETSTSVAQVPLRALGDGLIAISSTEDGVVVINQRDGTVMSGVWAMTAIRDLISGDIVTTGDKIWADKFFSSQGFFYLSEGRIYGRYPVVEIVVGPGGINQQFDLMIPVHGPGNLVYPATGIKVKVLDSESYRPGEVFSLPTRNGIPQFTLPQGIYHILVEFEGVRDWEQDPGGKG